MKICPRCGSSNIKWIIPQNWSMWSCNDCSFTGPAVEADKQTQKQLQKNWAKNKKQILSKTNNDETEENISDEELDEKLDKLFEENK
ncbi:hypothetical protein [Methanosphaera sp. BMS]|uniref:hypothetical protein n=1 Tax=Methanosphaera sp. BMS TaxID=1789762 RepID=UPI001F36D513|nr:hypothetical protein [Methanosphaera sp. BMS]